MGSRRFQRCFRADGQYRREVTTLKEMLAKLDIHDVWRTNHPDRKEYTWSKPTPFTARRIDYIFCDTTSLTKITNSSIEGFSHSDHKLVKVKINMNSFRRGPGYWKFNSSLLSEADFVAEANNFIDAHLSDYQNDNPEITWEMLKAKFKFFCIEYTHNRSKNWEYRKQKLVQELNESEHKLATEPQNGELQRKTLQLKGDLELQEIKQAQGAQVRSRAKWIENGEKNTKYFLRLEKIEVLLILYSTCKLETITRTTLPRS